MLRPRYKCSGIYWILILYVIIGIAYAKKHKDCDKDDLQCQTIISSSITSSFSSITTSSSTINSLSSSSWELETFSDFHEAKVANPKPNPDKPNSVQDSSSTFEDNINHNQDLGSSNEGNTNANTTSSSALSNVEAGILSACGILVVAGIAVGIFVWKNTSERRNLRQSHGTLDLEQNGHPDDDNDDDDTTSFKHTTKESSQYEHTKHQQGIKLPCMVYDKNDFFSNWQRKNDTGQGDFQYEPNQKSPTRVISEKAPAASDLRFQIPTFKHTLFSSEDEIQNSNKIRINIEEDDDDDSLEEKDTSPPNEHVVDDDYIITASHLRNSDYSPMFAPAPQLQPNNQARPSALDPTYDPAAITYPLQKFLRGVATTPNQTPCVIPIQLDHQDDDTESIEEAESVEETEPKQGSSRALNHQLTKLLRPERRQDMIKVDLDDDDDDDDDDNTTLLNLQKAYQELEQERKAVYDQEKSTEEGPAKIFTEDYKEEYFNRCGQSFISSLDLPDDQYIPLRNASGPNLISRAQVLADPIRRLGEDEIALWEQTCIKRELKRLSYEMWDEQMLRDEIEEYDRKKIENYYGKK
ncbi:hypothetical protein HPULCUR_004335 [Helicostylum pulchrum]|uniref:Uncharacterized protein n=1 Tax=Helicostylum pulchrum TaxID=562976 RepID=A0ABP9XVW8_9FUNG